jgi:hypothetical protein
MTPKKQTQINAVKRVLKETGKISRNDCIYVKHITTRLGAYIKDLRNEGWDIETDESSKTDCVYILKSKPHVPEVRIVEVNENGIIRRVARYV